MPWLQKEKDLKDTLLKTMEQARNQATADARALFNPRVKSADELDNVAKKMSFEARSGTKEECAEAYRVQYVFQKLIECRQRVMKTKERTETLKVYLPWYRVLLAFFRRMHYSLLRLEDDEN